MNLRKYFQILLGSFLLANTSCVSQKSQPKQIEGLTDKVIEEQIREEGLKLEDIVEAKPYVIDIAYDPKNNVIYYLPSMWGGPKTPRALMKVDLSGEKPVETKMPDSEPDSVGFGVENIACVDNKLAILGYYYQWFDNFHVLGKPEFGLFYIDFSKEGLDKPIVGQLGDYNIYEIGSISEDIFEGFCRMTVFEDNIYIFSPPGNSDLPREYCVRVTPDGKIIQGKDDDLFDRFEKEYMEADADFQRKALKLKSAIPYGFSPFFLQGDTAIGFVHRNWMIQKVTYKYKPENKEYK